MSCYKIKAYLFPLLFFLSISFPTYSAVTELYTKSQKCDDIALECLNIGGFDIHVSLTQPDNSSHLHLFQRKAAAFRCPSGYTLFEKANMIAEPYHISVCGKASKNVILNHINHKKRVQIFEGQNCPKSGKIIFSTSTIVACTFVIDYSVDSTSSSKLNKEKSTCTELGFTAGTEKFGECVLKLMDN